MPSLDARAQVLNIYDRRNGVGKRVFKLAPPGHDQMVAITAPRVCEPHGQCVMAAPSPPRLSAAWRVEAPSFSAALRSGVFSNCGPSVQVHGPS